MVVLKCNRERRGQNSSPRKVETMYFIKCAGPFNSSEIKDIREYCEENGIDCRELDKDAMTIGCNSSNVVTNFLSDMGFEFDEVEVTRNGYRNRIISLDYCHMCGNWCDDDDFCETHEGRLCCDCFDDNYVSCCNCGDPVRREDANTNSYGDDYCSDCYEDEYTCDFFRGVNKTFSAANSFGSSRSFGVELETASGTFGHNFAFDGKEDCSITGTECVSKILRGDDGLKEIRDFVASGNNVEVDDDCGFHLHVNVSDLNNDELYAVFAAYTMSEDFWHSQVSENREDGRFCQRLPDYMYDEIVEQCNKGVNFNHFACGFDRYIWMNVSAYSKFKTFENRLHEGTFNANRICDWVILNLRFVRAARRLRIEPHDTAETFAAKVKDCIEFAVNRSLTLPKLVVA